VILGVLNKPSGSEKFRKKWIEFDCQKGVHHGKYATYENQSRTRVKGGHIGRFDKVSQSEYGKRRVAEFIQNHDCHYPARFTQDLDECGIRGIEVENFPSGRGVGGLAVGGRASGSEEYPG
jgi:hypothetical protein